MIWLKLSLLVQGSNFIFLILFLFHGQKKKKSLHNFLKKIGTDNFPREKNLIKFPLLQGERNLQLFPDKWAQYKVIGIASSPMSHLICCSYLV